VVQQIIGNDTSERKFDKQPPTKDILYKIDNTGGGPMQLVDIFSIQYIQKIRNYKTTN
jgi:hypothetical protein